MKKVQLVIGDAAEVFDTMYPLHRIKEDGYQVLVAEDGQQAVEVFHSEQQRIDLVILDLSMPRLSGREAYQRMLEINPAVRVLFSSGYSADHAAQPGDSGVLGFVSKPYRAQDLVSTVRAALDKAKGKRGG